MTSKKVKQLVLIKTSKQYLTRLVRALEQKAGQHDKFLRYSEGINRHILCLLLVSLLLAKVEVLKDHECVCRDKAGLRVCLVLPDCLPCYVTIHQYGFSVFVNSENNSPPAIAVKGSVPQCKLCSFCTALMARQQC